MYAVIVSGGKQHRVELGTELAVDRLEAQPGQTIHFDQVLLVAGIDEPAVGRPHVAGAAVSADVVRHERGEKVIVFKYRPKARHRSKNGARADLTVLRVSDIVHGGQSAAKLAESARTERERLEAAAAEAAATQAEADKVLARQLAKATATPEPEGPTSTKAGSRGRRTSRQGSGPAAAPTAAAEAAADQAAAGKPAGRAKAKPSVKAEAKQSRDASARTQAPQPLGKDRARPKKDR